MRTLRNAIELDKVHHAYLFVGSRGTGKTSMAKLLACALNATGGPNVAFDPEDQAAKAILGRGVMPFGSVAALHANLDELVGGLRAAAGHHRRVAALRWTPPPLPG